MQDPPDAQQNTPAGYRGRIAPTPSGWLHLGHAITFGEAWRRARERSGVVLYRTEDLDPDRCRAAYVDGAVEDLRWWGLDWDEGPDVGGPHAPYVQSERLELFKNALTALRGKSLAYPSPHSRKEIAEWGSEKSPVDGDRLFPAELRQDPDALDGADDPFAVNWRFRVPDGREITFHDNRLGQQTFTAGRDFGDFLVWRKDGVPAYELAVVVDDHAMAITEVVRGEDLLLSTARQLLLYEAMGWEPPEWYHCELVKDPSTGKRLSKTHKSLALRAMRDAGAPPSE